MRLGYKIVIPLVVTAIAFVALSWFLANDGYWFYWIFEVLGFSMLIIFGMGVGMLLPLYYWSVSQGNSAKLSSIEPTNPIRSPDVSREVRKCAWCGTRNRAGMTVCPGCGKVLA